MTSLGLMLSDDLIFFSRMASVARAKGLTVRQVKTGAELLQQARLNPPTGLILDLQNPGLELPRLLAEIKDICPRMPYLVGYGSHVEAAVLRAARTAGCELVLPRSQFVERLEEGLEQWLKYDRKDDRDPLS